MIAAPERDPGLTVDGDSDACPQCGTASRAPTLLTSMTRYYACGSCPTRWSVARDWLSASGRSLDGLRYGT